MKRKIAPGLVLCGLGIAGPLGCMGNHPDPLDSRLFVAPSIPEIAGRSAVASPDVSAATPAVDVEHPAVAGELPKNAAILPDSPGPTTQPFDTIEPLEELGSATTTQPSQMQASEAVAPQPRVTTIETAGVNPAPPTVEIQGQGVYMTLGGVVAEVNGTPIYANQVLAPLKKEFAVKARELDADEFRRFATEEIWTKLKELINDELYFATAYHALSQEDRNLAEAQAMMIRHDKVIAAGGSVEQARHRAADDGEDFDDLIRQDYRLVVYDVYEHREITPFIQVSADSMRDFYTQNVGKLYSTKDQAQFRVIEIDPANCDSMIAAKGKISSIRERAVNGEDFTALASTQNDSTYLKNRGGNPLDAGAWMERNSYMNEEVETAIWRIQPGQITPIVQTQGKLYIAKLEARRLGIVRPFEEMAVQADIYARLRQQQLNAALQLRKDESATQAMINTDEKRVDVAVEMAMQKYAQLQLAAGR